MDGEAYTGMKYRVFMLRMWKEASYAGDSQGGWRFHLEDPATRLRRGFSSIEELGTFLRGILPRERQDAPGEDAPFRGEVALAQDPRSKEVARDALPATPRRSRRRSQGGLSGACE